MNANIEKIVNSEMSKSKKMLALYEMNLTIKEIAAVLNVRYNFVYNVVSNFCNVNNITIATNKKEGPTKKEEAIKMYAAGKSKKEISVALKMNATYVQNVIKEYKESIQTNEA